MSKVLSFFAAASLAIFSLSVSANAATLSFVGGTPTLGPGSTIGGLIDIVTVDDGSGNFSGSLTINTSSAPYGVSSGFAVSSIGPNVRLSSVSLSSGSTFNFTKISDIYFSLASALINTGTFTLNITGQLLGGNPSLLVGELSYGITSTPLPPAALLFGSVLAGAGIWSRRRKSGATAA